MCKETKNKENIENEGNMEDMDKENNPLNL